MCIITQSPAQWCASSSYAVCITPQSQVIKKFKLRSLNLTAKSDSAVCMHPSAESSQVSVLQMLFLCGSQFVQGIFFSSKVFRKNEVKRCISTKYWHFLISLTLWCASHLGAELRSVHPTAESSSTVCITQRSQGHQISQKTPRCASHRGVRLHGVLPTTESKSKYLRVSGQSGEIL